MQDSTDAFAAVHREYESRVFRFLQDRLGDYETAQDATVATFVQAFRAWDRFPDNTRVEEWLMSLARSVAAASPDPQE